MTKIKLKKVLTKKVPLSNSFLDRRYESQCFNENVFLNDENKIKKGFPQKAPLSNSFLDKRYE
jgi:hypothetical protein